jgi:tetratricopeptide (TPR) repeat protein
MSDDILKSLRLAVARTPGSADAHHKLGIFLARQNKLNEAAACISSAIALMPDPTLAYFDLGNIFLQQRNLADAEAAYGKVLAKAPQYAPAHFNLGATLCQRNRISEGFAAFTRAAKIKYARGIGKADAPKPHKAQHDREQRDHLAGGKADFNAPAIDEIFRLGDGERITSGAVNVANAQTVSSTWAQSYPQVVVIDDFLTPQALKRLRAFCRDSTVWRRTYDDGYLGAMPEFGFSPPLLAQIAEELRVTFPDIFRDHPLNYFWAFKYDSKLNGIRVHADHAAVNVNFWITPDEANLDPTRGGLVVWDAKAPTDWGLKKYNGDEKATRDYLARNKANAIRVPYRANRAVIFDSSLFHETDVITFKDGYVNRRINVTLLYGARKT